MAQKGPQDLGTAQFFGVVDLTNFAATVADDTIEGGAGATLTITTKNLVNGELSDIELDPHVHPVAGGTTPVILPDSRRIRKLSKGETEVTTFLIDNSGNVDAAKFRLNVHVTGLPGNPIHFTEFMDIP